MVAFTEDSTAEIRDRYCCDGWILSIYLKIITPDSFQLPCFLILLFSILSIKNLFISIFQIYPFNFEDFLRGGGAVMIL